MIGARPFLVLTPASTLIWLVSWLRGPTGSGPIGANTFQTAPSLDSFLSQLTPDGGLIEPHDAGVVLPLVEFFRPVPEVLVIGSDPAPSVSDLADVNCCAWVWEHLLGTPFDFNWWQVCSREGPSRDPVPAGECPFQAEIAPALAAARAGDWVRIGLEPYPAFRLDAEPLLAEHHSEVTAPSEPWRALSPVWAEFERAASRGELVIVSARRNGTLVGYCIWKLERDSDSGGLPSAIQGAWFASREAPAGTGTRLLSRSLTLLANAGIVQASLHHPAIGRGARLGPLFKRLGAVQTSTTYMLKLEDRVHA